jgi:hypothetical protein
LLHRGHHIRRAEIHFLPRGCAAGNQICAHVVFVIPSEVEESRSVVSLEHPTDNQRCFAPLNMT